MTARGIDVVRAHLATLPPSASLTIAERRAQYDRAERVFPTPPDGVIERATAPERPAEWLRPPGARTDAAILYLHGGGYVIGPPRPPPPPAAAGGGRLHLALGRPHVQRHHLRDQGDGRSDRHPAECDHDGAGLRGRARSQGTAAVAAVRRSARPAAAARAGRQRRGVA